MASLRDTLKLLIGSAWTINGDSHHDTLLPAVDGTVEANKVLVVDASKKLDTLDVTALKTNGVALNPSIVLPDAQYSTAALQSAAMTGAQVAGAKTVAFDNTGTTPGNLQMATAAQIVAAIPNAAVGQSYVLKIRNSSGSANTATITTNTGITLTGTMTIAQNVTREFIVTLTSLTAVTVQSMGVSAAGA